MRDVRSFFHANPQVLVLLIICVVLGFGTFLAVVFGLISSSPGTQTGEPTGRVLAAHTLAAAFAGW